MRLEKVGGVRTGGSPPYSISMDAGQMVFRKALSLRETDPAGAAVAFEKAEALFEAEGKRYAAGECALGRARLASEALDLDLAVVLATRAADFFVSRPARRAEAFMLAGHAAAANDSLIRAREYFQRGAQSGAYRAAALEALGLLDFDRGDLDGAERHYRSAWRALSDSASVLEIASLHERFAELALARGEPLAACLSLSTALAVLETARSAEARLMEARVRIELADLCASLGQVNEALREYRRVLAYYEAAALDRRVHGVRQRISALQWRSDGFASKSA